jgi:hypothetical protein
LDKKSIAFHRQYYAYSGGHQKVCDYLRHTIAFEGYLPSLWLDNCSVVQSQLFDDIKGVDYVEKYAPDKADAVFLAGMDWQAYQPFFDAQQPKINLIQHIRHGDKNHPLFQFLQHRAIRLCVSDAVRDAILPYANGPCITIRMGHKIPKRVSPKRYDLYILAPKQPELGKQLFVWANSIGLRVLMHDVPTERELVYQAMAESVVAIPLPNKTEGFFLPGIEAMALADWAVVPDCIASREYTLPTANVSSCQLNLASCQQAIEDALQKATRWRSVFSRRKGEKICRSYDPANERRSFHHVLKQIEQLW